MIRAAWVPENELPAEWVVSMDASGKGGGVIILWLLGSVQCDQCLHLHLSTMEIATEYFQWSRRMGFPHFLWFDCLGRVLPQCPGLQTANLPSVLTLGYLLPLCHSNNQALFERDSKLTQGLWTFNLASVCLKLLPYFVFLKFPVI